MPRRLILLALGLLAAGCGTQEITASARTGTAAVVASSSPTQCSVWLQGHLAEIFFSSGTLQVQPICDRWAQVRAGVGEFWQENEVAASTNAEHLVCSLQDGPILATVDDGEDAFYGQQTCSALLAGGNWRELGH